MWDEAREWVLSKFWGLEVEVLQGVFAADEGVRLGITVSSVLPALPALHAPSVLPYHHDHVYCFRFRFRMVA